MDEPDFFFTESDLSLFAAEDEFWTTACHDDWILDAAIMSFWNLDHLGAVLDDFFVSFLDKGLRTAFKSGNNIIFIQDMDVFVSSDLDNTSHLVCL